MEATIRMVDNTETGGIDLDIKTNFMGSEVESDYTDSDALYHTVLFKAILTGHLPEAYAVFEQRMEEILDKMAAETHAAAAEELDQQEGETNAE